jgi:hypothetical protein
LWGDESRFRWGWVGCAALPFGINLGFRLIDRARSVASLDMAFVEAHGALKPQRRIALRPVGVLVGKAAAPVAVAVAGHAAANAHPPPYQPADGPRHHPGGVMVWVLIARPPTQDVLPSNHQCSDLVSATTPPARGSRRGQHLGATIGQG